MGNWQVTGRLKTSFAVVAGAVAVSMVAPAAAQAAANEDSSSNDSSNRAAANVPAKQKNIPATTDAPVQQASSQQASAQRAGQASSAAPERSGASGAALEQGRYRIENGQRVEVPAAALDLNDDLTRLVYTFLPTRTVLDPAQAQAEVVALRDAMALYLSSQIEQLRKTSEDPDGAVKEFVRSELQRFQDDPAGYVGELRAKMATTAADAAGSLDESTDRETPSGPIAAASGEVIDDRPAADRADSSQAAAASPAESTGAGAVTIGDRVAARAQSAAATSADVVQQSGKNLEAAGGKVWDTAVPANAPADDGARSDIFTQLPTGQPLDAETGPGQPIGVGPLP
jgi:hypothetical protein